GMVVRNVELTAEIYKLDKFTVAGEREGTAKAEVLQRLAPNVKAVVSSDTFGNVADGNVGELLQHMAGMTANYNGPDVRQVSIRGVTADLNSVTMDGQQIASAQSAGTGRAFEFEQASLGNIETIEVTKAPTPDMAGASIGGSVNLVSKSAFDRSAGRIFNYSVGFVTRPIHGPDATTWKQPIKGYGPSINFLYSDVVGEKKNFGITVTGTYHSQPPVNAITAQTFERKNEPGPVFDYSTSRTVGGATRSRVATGVKLDYKWSEQTTVSLNTSYNFFHENNYSPNHTLTTVGIPTSAVPNVLATVNASGNRIGGGYINPNYANGITRVYPHPTLSFSNYSLSLNDKSGRTILLSPMVRHRFDALTIDYSLSYSNSANYYDVSHKNDKYDNRPKGSVTMRLGNIGWIVDRSKDSEIPAITQTEGPDMRNLDNYGSLVLTQADQRGFDTVLSGKFDLRKEFAFTLPTFVKTGFAYQSQERKLWRETHRYRFAGADGVYGNADDNKDLGQFTERTGIAQEIDDHYFKDRGGAPVWPSGYAIARHAQLYPELWSEDVAFGAQQTLQSFRFITEKIGAVYFMGNVRFGPFSVLSGVRVEETRLNGEGPLTYLSPEEKARRAAWVGTVTPAEQRRRAEAQYGGRTTSSGNYRDVFPGVHLKYEPFTGMLMRLSWSTGVGRPAFGSIIPLDTVNDDSNPPRVTRNNPNLKPQHGNNYDLSAEYYFKSQGVVSCGVFKKDIEDYIETESSQIIGTGSNNGFDGDYAGYALTTQVNSGSAKIEGIEVNYQQQLSFLPSWAKGFGFSANYTKLRTYGDNSAFRTGPTSSAGGTLAGFLSSSGNIGLSYRGHGFDLRLQAVYRGEYLTSNSATPALIQYQVAKTTWYWKSRYAFSRRLSVFFDVENIFGEPLDLRYRLYRDRISNWRNFDPKFVTGITGRF
ncbi:MAG: TonB-dependent receptor, partial [Verrucomicrobia bacterium]|nr:TonB-dependent receptor [Verrucomicrobiota bacterium]